VDRWRSKDRRYKGENFHYAARGAGDGSFVPHCGQFAQPNSTLRPQLGQVGSSDVPQCGQNVYPDFRTWEHPGHGFISGSRKMK
jgi:hypothetical protein